MRLHAALALFPQVFPGVLYAPQWHRTPDGCMPHRMFWAWLAMLDVPTAHQRTQIAIGTRIGGAPGPAAQRALDDEQARMHPA